MGKQIVVDREEDNCKVFGTASDKFKLKKVKKPKNEKPQCKPVMDVGAIADILIADDDDVKKGDSENESNDVPKMGRMKRSNSVTSPRDKQTNKKKKKDSELWSNGGSIDEEKKKKKSKKTKGGKKKKKKASKEDKG